MTSLATDKTPFLVRLFVPKPLWGLVTGRRRPTQTVETTRREALARALSAGSRDILDAVLPDDYEVGQDFLRVNGKYLRTFEVGRLPRTITPGWLADLHSLDVELDTGLHHTLQDADEMKERFGVKLGDQQTAESIALKEDEPGDDDRTLAIRDMYRVREEIAAGETELFEGALLVTVRADTMEQLGRWEPGQKRWTGDCGKVEAVFRRNGGRFQVATRRQPDAFLGTLPVGIDTSRRHQTITSRGLAYSTLACIPSVGMEHGVEYGRDSYTGRPLLHDVFSPELPNGCTAIIAMSGWGKSYLEKLATLRSLFERIWVEGVGWMLPEVYVIDPENEYRRLCGALPEDAQFVALDLAGTAAFNPFDVPAAVADDVDDQDVLTDHIGTTLLPLFNLLLAADPDHPLTTRQQTVLSRNVRTLYDTLPHPPVMGDLYAALTQDVGDPLAVDLAAQLEAHVGDGQYAGLFPGQTNVNLSRRLVAFGLRDIPDEPERLRAVAIHLITAWVWGNCRRELRPRHVLIDECGSVMRFAGAFLKKLATRSRKRWLAPVFIFQTIEQALVSSSGKEVLDNCATVILKRHPYPINADATARYYHLDRAKRAFIGACDKSEGLLITPRGVAEFQAVASPGEHRLCTSAPAEVAAIEAQERAQQALLPKPTTRGATSKAASVKKPAARRRAAPARPAERPTGPDVP